MSYTFWLVICTLALAGGLAYFGRNERLSGNAIVYTGLGILAVAAIGILIGYTMGIEKQVAHSDLVRALMTVALFTIAWPFVSFFVKTAIEMPPEPQHEEE